MFDKEQGLIIARNDKGPLCINGRMANRHGLVAGATGTGKTVTLQTMAETFSQAGVPCFMADMKGDLSGVSQGCPVRFYDVYGEQGHPMRATVSQMGPQLLARLLGLNDTQDGVLNIVFRIADEKGLLIIDIKDLRAALDYVARNSRQYTSRYGNIAQQTIGAIQRSLLQLENQGADRFFGEPAFDIDDLMATVTDGHTAQKRGMLSVLAADKLMLQPKLYSTFLLWLLSELYSNLPEVGDQPMPRLVFFFDEAHMLFDGTSKALLDKIEQVVRLIRSKGVGIFFVTQNPADIPDTILGQLGNRVQHALRAYTPKDQKAVKAAADTFRANPDFSTYEAITSLSTGEALVSFLDEKGAPKVVERAKVVFPQSQVGAVTAQQREQCIRKSDIYGKYDTVVDRESAYETLRAMEEQETAPQETERKGEAARQKQGLMAKVWKAVLTAVTTTVAAMLGTWVSDKVAGKTTKSRTSAKERVVKNATSAATRTITRELTRDILGNLVKK